MITLYVLEQIGMATDRTRPLTVSCSQGEVKALHKIQRLKICIRVSAYVDILLANLFNSGVILSRIFEYQSVPV